MQVSNVFSKKQITIFGCIVYFILALLAVYFYKGRIVFIDLAYHSVKIINHQHFELQSDRYGAFLSQIIPLIAVWCKSSLSTILISYSVSFVIINFLFFAVINLICNNQKLALTLIVFSCLQQHSFFWPQSELQLGIGFLLMSLAIVEKINKKTNSIKYLTYFLLAFCNLWFHPLLLVLSSGLLLLSLLRKEKHHLFFLLLILLLAVLKIIILKSSSYDNQAYGKLTNLIKVSPFQQFLTKSLLRVWIYDGYFIYIILFIASCIFLFKANKKEFIYYTTYNLLYFYLISIAYFEGVARFYFENLFLPLLVLNTLVFAQYLNLKKYLTILLACIGIYFIYNAHSDYTKRFDWHKKYLSMTPTSKMIINESSMNTDTTIMNWGLGYELLLLQALKSDTIKYSLIVVPNNEHIDNYKKINHSFIGNWEIKPYQDMNQNYFKFFDSSYYQIIK